MTVTLAVGDGGPRTGVHEADRHCGVEPVEVLALAGPRWVQAIVACVPFPDALAIAISA